MTRGVRRMRRRMRLVWRSRSRIRRVAQPPDGYLPLSLFDEVRLADPVPLYAFEDVPADATGLAVDYLSRVARGVPARDAFRVPLAVCLVGRSADAERLLAMVDGFSDRSVRAACLLCGFDAASRRGPARWRAGRVIDPGPATVQNVRRTGGAHVEVHGPGWGRSCGRGSRSTAATRTGSRPETGTWPTADGLWDLKVSRWRAEPDVHAAAARLLAARPAFHASRVSQGAASGPVQRAVGHDVERSRGPDQRRCRACGGAGCDRLCGRSLTLAPAAIIGSTS